MAAKLPTLVELIENFFDNRFGFDDAFELFGTPGEEDEDRIELIPIPKRNLADAFLERMKSADGSYFLEGVNLEYEKPANFDFGELIKKYGPPVETARLKPYHPIPYHFTVKDHHFEGYFMLGATRPSKAGVRSVAEFTMRRFPREVPKRPSLPPRQWR